MAGYTGETAGAGEGGRCETVDGCASRSRRGSVWFKQWCTIWIEWGGSSGASTDEDYFTKGACACSADSYGDNDIYTSWNHTRARRI